MSGSLAVPLGIVTYNWPKDRGCCSSKTQRPEFLEVFFFKLSLWRNVHAETLTWPGLASGHASAISSFFRLARYIVWTYTRIRRNILLLLPPWSPWFEAGQDCDTKINNELDKIGNETLHGWLQRHQPSMRTHTIKFSFLSTIDCQN